MRVLVTGGGTGGHIYPALAIAEGIRNAQPEAEVLYVGLREGMEARLVPENGWEFRGIAGRGMPRRISLGMLKTMGSSVKAFWQTKKILKGFHPDLVVGTGGFVSGPVLLVASLFGFPTLLHEQNVWPGMTNKLLARRVKKVMLAFEEGRAHFPERCPVEVVGQPVRPQVGHVERSEGLEFFGLVPGKKVLLVTGGSRGARSLNRAMVTVAEHLSEREDMQLIWATGTLDYEDTLAELKRVDIDPQRRGWCVAAYIENMPQALAAADLCVCRAGATTLAELSAARLPSILIPYPHAAENHQEFNARALVERKAARLILDKELTGDGLWEKVDELLKNAFVLEEMAARTGEALQGKALERIVRICLETAWR
ncbi:MAG: undecaprenyldiphospho-muramoylpentapeptide beta-N-acetylglucosaminyltransferase [Peptococcaceae bacterium]|nr:undecaprenyldiphospho-muramoylpentapeptide beta-N-acetylglucosaminyltransferase [Peptococcaceae bacterium]